MPQTPDSPPRSLGDDQPEPCTSFTHVHIASDPALRLISSGSRLASINLRPKTRIVEELSAPPALGDRRQRHGCPSTRHARSAGTFRISATIREDARTAGPVALPQPPDRPASLYAPQSVPHPPPWPRDNDRPLTSPSQLQPPMPPRRRWLRCRPQVEPIMSRAQEPCAA